MYSPFLSTPLLSSGQLSLSWDLGLLWRQVFNQSVKGTCDGIDGQWASVMFCVYNSLKPQSSHVHQRRKLGELVIGCYSTRRQAHVGAKTKGNIGSLFDLLLVV
jgi:hypothetical protein